MGRCGPPSISCPHSRERQSKHLGQAPELTEDDIALERPKNRDHGDWATSIALKLAKVAGSNPRDLATAIATELLAHEGIQSAEVAGPWVSSTSPWMPAVPANW
jgi:arginyl-tRNA synthetase